MVLDSGRRVAVQLTIADATDRTVVFCHAAPGAGGFDPAPEVTRASHVRLLSVDRPGYGGSSPVAAGEWATVASAADDLAAVIDSLPVERVGVVGWSAGGRVALALAARRPDLVDRVAVVATPAPDKEVPWVGDDERDQLKRLRGVPPDEAHARLAERLGADVPDDPRSPEALWLLGACGADEPALGGDGVRARLGAMLHAAFDQGARGLAADIAGYCLQPWGFEPEAVEAETLLLYGSRDPIADPQHGRWWHSRLPSAQLEVVAGAGHLVVVQAWARVLAHVSPDRGRLHLVEEFSAA
jgi:pimeloyl-ACP methyl ester carboxylesterase